MVMGRKFSVYPCVINCNFSKVNDLMPHSLLSKLPTVRRVDKFTQRACRILINSADATNQYSVSLRLQ